MSMWKSRCIIFMCARRETNSSGKFPFPSLHKMCIVRVHCALFFITHNFRSSLTPRSFFCVYSIFENNFSFLIFNFLGCARASPLRTAASSKENYLLLLLLFASIRVLFLFVPPSFCLSLSRFFHSFCHNSCHDEFLVLCVYAGKTNIKVFPEHVHRTLLCVIHLRTYPYILGRCRSSDFVAAPRLIIPE